MGTLWLRHKPKVDKRQWSRAAEAEAAQIGAHSEKCFVFRYVGENVKNLPPADNPRITFVGHGILTLDGRFFSGRMLVTVALAALDARQAS